MPFYEGPQLAQTTSPCLLGNNPAALEQGQSRNTPDTHFGSNVRAIVHVDFGNGQLFTKFIGDRLKHGSNRLAGATPGCPEVNQYGAITLNNRLLKIYICYFYHVAHRQPPRYKTCFEH